MTATESKTWAKNMYERRKAALLRAIDDSRNETNGDRLLDLAEQLVAQEQARAHLCQELEGCEYARDGESPFCSFHAAERTERDV